MSQNKRKLTPVEIQTLHSEVAAFVQDYMQTNENPDMAIATYEECDVGIEALSCPLINAVSLRFEQSNDLIRARFPGSSIYMEKMPNGSANVALQIPIWVDQVVGRGGGGREYHAAHVSSKNEPSMTTGLFLFMSLVLDCTIIYFRLATSAA